MKILFIQSEREKEGNPDFGFFLEKMNIHTSIFSVMDKLDSNAVKQFITFFNFPVSIQEGRGQILGSRTEITSHVVIISSLPKQWFDFIFGFSCGSHVPFIFYGKNTVLDIPDEFLSNFTVLETEDSFKEYFEAENEVYKRHEAVMEITKARENLLQSGIPLTNEACAHLVAEGHFDEVSLFLTAGFLPDTRDKSGVPLLNIAARHGQREILRLLIRLGAKLNLQADDRGSSAVIDSVLGKHKDILNDLIEAGADMNLRSKDGQSALIVAVGISDEVIVEELLKAGADPDIPDSLGMSARKYASLFNKKNITVLFDEFAPQKGDVS